METYEKILVLNNEFEAGLLEEVLKDRNIPHTLVNSDDTALGGIMEMELGWGYVEAPEACRAEIMQLYEEITSRDSQPDGEPS